MLHLRPLRQYSIFGRRKIFERINVKKLKEREIFKMNKKYGFYSLSVTLALLSFYTLFTIEWSPKIDSKKREEFVVKKGGAYFGSRSEISPEKTIVYDGKIWRLSRYLEALHVELLEDKKTIRFPTKQDLFVGSKWLSIKNINNAHFELNFVDQNGLQKKIEMEYKQSPIPPFRIGSKSSTTLKPYWIFSSEKGDSVRYDHIPEQRPIYSLFERVTQTEWMGKKLVGLVSDDLQNFLLVNPKHEVYFFIQPGYSDKLSIRTRFRGREWTNGRPQMREVDMYRSDEKNFFLQMNDGRILLIEFDHNGTDPFSNLIVHEEIRDGVIKNFRPKIESMGLFDRLVEKNPNGSGNVIYFGGNPYTTKLQLGQRVLALPVYSIDGAAQIVPNYILLSDKYVKNITRTENETHEIVTIEFDYRGSKDTGTIEVIGELTTAWPFDPKTEHLGPVKKKQQIVVREIKNGSQVVKEISGNWTPGHYSDSAIFNYYVRYPYDGSWFATETFLPEGRDWKYITEASKYILKLRMREIYIPSLKNERFSKDGEGALYCYFQYDSKKKTYIGDSGVKAEFTIKGQKVVHFAWKNGYNIRPDELAEGDRGFVQESVFHNVVRDNGILYYLKPIKQSIYSDANMEDAVPIENRKR